MPPPTNAAMDVTPKTRPSISRGTLRWINVSDATLSAPLPSAADRLRRHRHPQRRREPGEECPHRRQAPAADEQRSGASGHGRWTGRSKRRACRSRTRPPPARTRAVPLPTLRARGTPVRRCRCRRTPPRGTTSARPRGRRRDDGRRRAPPGSRPGSSNAPTERGPAAAWGRAGAPPPIAGTRPHRRTKAPRIPSVATNKPPSNGTDRDLHVEGGAQPGVRREQVVLIDERGDRRCGRPARRSCPGSMRSPRRR